MDADSKACLMIHGFTGGPYELEPLANYLSADGWFCRLPVLPGHGEHTSRMDGVRWIDWLHTCDDEASKLSAQYERFTVIGFSMGGLLAAYIANRYPVNRLVLLCAPVIYVSPVRLFRDTAEQIRRKQWDRWRKTKTVPMRTVMQFVSLSRRLRPEFANISVPTLVVQGENDPVVHPYSAKILQRTIPSETIVRYYSKSKHQICLGQDAESVFCEVHSFLSRDN